MPIARATIASIFKVMIKAGVEFGGISVLKLTADW